MSLYTPIAKRYPKAKPLALTLIAAAAEQGASIEEMEKACDLARSISGSVVNASAPKTVSEIRNDVETIIKGI